MTDTHLSRGEIIKGVAARIFSLILFLFAMFFLPAGTFAYWQAWLYMAVLLTPMFCVIVYLFKKDPGLLERRMRMKEKETEQKKIIKSSYLFFLLAFLLPGFDQRFGWSNVAPAAAIAADVLVLLSYGLFFLVLRENSYASRIIEVEADQKVISSGPYAVIRHPMYLGISLMFLFTPLALGSYWAMLSSVLIVPLLVARIRSEESLLQRELKGYTEYMQKTKYRLIPGVW